MKRPARFTQRVAQTWLDLYTAGLAESVVVERRSEIENDLAEHARERAVAGWSVGRTARERLGRTVRGMPSDVLWRREALLAQQGKSVPVSLAFATVRWLRTCWHVPIAAVLATFFMVALFSAHGLPLLDDSAFLGGVGAFEPDEQGALVAGTVIIAGFTVTLLAGALTRALSFSVKGANVVMLVGTLPTMAMLWMVTPAILTGLVVMGAAFDLSRHARALQPPSPRPRVGSQG